MFPVHSSEQPVVRDDLTSLDSKLTGYWNIVKSKGDSVTKKKIFYAFSLKPEKKRQ